MHIFWTVLLALIAFGWMLEGIDLARGVPSMASLDHVGPLSNADCPTVSILFAARDEAEKLPGALATFLALDYPKFEVIAADDRSIDGTGQILDSEAQTHSHLKPVHIDSLPSGWLGKPHALQRAYEQSNGEWLVFTDADVHFAPDLLRRALALAQQQRWDHLTLLGCAKMFTVGEKIAMTFFGMGFVMWVRPWSISNITSTGYAGVGAFQLIRRSAYEAIGAHRRLAMEVVDDMKLGKLVKAAGFLSGVAKAGAAVSVHWHSGVRNMIHSTAKNFFATTGFRLSMTIFQLFALFLMCVLPVIALPFVHGWARAFDVIAIALPIVAHGGVCREFRVSPIYALTYPLGAIIFGSMLAYSTLLTLSQNGIVWRGTFYHLDDLKRGML